MNNKLTTRSLVEGALMAALATILMLLSSFPVIGAFVLLFCSIPITVVTVRNTPFTGALTAVLATVLIALFMGPLSAISGGLQYLLLGWVIGYMLYHRKSGSKTLQAAALTAAIAGLLMLVITIGLMGFSPQAISAYLDEYSANMMEMYQSTGMIEMMQQQGMSTNQVEQMMQQAIQLTVRILPAMMVIIRALMALVTYFLTAQVLKRLKIRIPRIHNFQKWGLPAGSVWGLILVWALWLASDYIHISWINILALNCLIVYGALLFLDGVALSNYWFKFSQMSTGMKIVGVLFVMLFFTGFLIACLLMGLADLLFDFRKLRADNKKGK